MEGLESVTIVNGNIRALRSRGPSCTLVSFVVNELVFFEPLEELLCRAELCYARTLASTALARRNHGRSRRFRYPGMVGFLSRIFFAHSRASDARPCDSRKSA